MLVIFGSYNNKDQQDTTQNVNSVFFSCNSMFFSFLFFQDGMLLLSILIYLEMTTAPTSKASSIKLKKIDPDDISVLVDYRLLYLTELQGEMDVDYREQLRRDLTDYFERAISEGRFMAILAEDDEKIVSFGGMVIKEIPGDVKRSTYLEGDILNMYTVPEARRKGISSLILEKLLSEAKIMGITKVALHTSKDGEKLYRKFGFSEPHYPYLERIID